MRPDDDDSDIQIRFFIELCFPTLEKVRSGLLLGPKEIGRP